MLSFLISIIVLWLPKKMCLFLENTHGSISEVFGSMMPATYAPMVRENNPYIKHGWEENDNTKGGNIIAVGESR